MFEVGSLRAAVDSPKPLRIRLEVVYVTTYRPQTVIPACYNFYMSPLSNNVEARHSMDLFVM
ncbi:hypothetical protein J6590_015556 [Homalodisca vitripennis]|nr:hypothetical protein J6590_015556 [Homalodisca vitripennis]